MRTVLCQDSIPWLASNMNRGAIVTSLPDAAEMEMPIHAWRDWFTAAAGACMISAGQSHAVIFYQTDRKIDGGIESKADLLFRAAQLAGCRTLWHKIALRRAVGATELFRPGFTHLIAFSRKARCGMATPDVFDRGATLYLNGMGIMAAKVAIRFAQQTTTTIIDPFCGRGTVLAVAEANDLEAIGIDIDPKQVEFARTLELEKVFI